MSADTLLEQLMALPAYHGVRWQMEDVPRVVRNRQSGETSVISDFLAGAVITRHERQQIDGKLSYSVIVHVSEEKFNSLIDAAENAPERESGEELYYIQNKGYVGNSMLWWRKGGKGYTCDLNAAWRVTRGEAEAICKNRPKEDFMHSVAEIDGIACRHVDMQAMHKAALESDLVNGTEGGQS